VASIARPNTTHPALRTAEGRGSLVDIEFLSRESDSHRWRAASLVTIHDFPKR
jgi:hypothetical protein